MAVTRAVAIVEPGGPEVLRVIERDARDPGPGVRECHPKVPLAYSR
ncbi:MAG TPA: hypothetical protein VF327_07235 [Gaiellaceae bacterium]